VTAANENGGPVAEVGEWAEEKLTLLRRYIEISAQARAKYVHKTEATYIDLYCGPGLSRVRGSAQIRLGSPLVAWEAAHRSRVQFNRYFVADVDPAYSLAAQARLEKRGATALSKIGKAEKTASEIVAEVDHGGLHFALLDPFNLGDLPFAVIETLAKLRRIDLMIHLSTGDLQRNFREIYMQRGNQTLRRFAPGWRPDLLGDLPERQMRDSLVQHWFTLVQGLGFGPAARDHL
jgi:three-Cys-motif partner protein